MPFGVGPSSEEYYPTVAVAALMKILRDPSLNAHHTAVVTAIMYIFKTLGLKCVPFLPQVGIKFIHYYFSHELLDNATHVVYDENMPSRNA